MNERKKERKKKENLIWMEESSNRLGKKGRRTKEK